MAERGYRVEETKLRKVSTAASADSSDLRGDVRVIKEYWMSPGAISRDLPMTMVAVVHWFCRGTGWKTPLVMREFPDLNTS
jgi:hypothetical protein